MYIALTDSPIMVKYRKLLFGMNLYPISEDTEWYEIYYRFLEEHCIIIPGTLNDQNLKVDLYEIQYRRYSDRIDQIVCGCVCVFVCIFNNLSTDFISQFCKFSTKMIKILSPCNGSSTRNRHIEVYLTIIFVYRNWPPLQSGNLRFPNSVSIWGWYPLFIAIVV